MTITISVEGNAETGKITVPIQIPAVPIPGVVLLSKDADHKGELFLMVRTGSALSNAGQIVAALNSVIDVINKVKDVLGWAALVTPLGDAVNTITNAGGLAGLATGGASDLEDYDGFDDEASSVLLIAPTNTKVQFWNSSDFSGPLVGDTLQPLYKRKTLAAV